MPIPVISTTTSILGFPQFQTWEFQPSATESPTSWACSPLPTGISINTTTGKISGAGTVEGVTTANLTATNGSGASVALVLTIGIEANSQSATDAPAFAIDIQTGAIGPTSGAVIAAKTPLFWMKEGDIFPLLLKWYNLGEFVDFNISSLKVTLKQYEPESGILSAGGATLNTHFVKIGTGEEATWMLVIDASSTALASALGDYEGDAGTAFLALMEIEWKYPNPFAIGAGTFVRSTRTFVVGIERDLVA